MDRWNSLQVLREFHVGSRARKAAAATTCYAADMAWMVVGMLATTLALVCPQSASAAQNREEELERALEWIRAATEWKARYDYVVGGEVLLLLTWVGDEDVGEGYIRLGEKKGDSSLEIIELLFGSDPEKAPMELNRWGAATEVVRRSSGPPRADASAFLGFRKKSASAEGQETPPRRVPGRRRPQDERAFEASLNYIDSRRAVASTIPFSADEKLDLGDMQQVEQQALEAFSAGNLAPRTLLGRQCDWVPSFLFTMSHVIERLISSQGELDGLCYVYNAQEYTLSVKTAQPVDRHTTDIELESGERFTRTYKDLVKAEVGVVNRETGGETSFQLLVGRSGRWRGVPVEIAYEPLPWLRLTLRLRRVTREGESVSAASRQATAVF